MGMEVRFKTPELAALEVSNEGSRRYPREVVFAYRKRLLAIRSATDERQLYQVGSTRFKKLQGDRAHQYSMRLNDQWRLILEIEKADPKNVIVVVDIEDYH